MLFETPFAEGKPGLPFKVDYDEVLSRKQNLTEVIITVYASLHRTYACLVYLTEAIQYVIFQRQHTGCDSTRFRPQSRKRLLQQVESFPHQLAQGGVQRSLVVGSKRFRRKCRIAIRLRSERQVKFGRALTQAGNPLIKASPNQ